MFLNGGDRQKIGSRVMQVASQTLKRLAASILSSRKFIWWNSFNFVYTLTFFISCLRLGFQRKFSIQFTLKVFCLWTSNYLSLHGKSQPKSVPQPDRCCFMLSAIQPAPSLLLSHTSPLFKAASTAIPTSTQRIANVLTLKYSQCFKHRKMD